MVFFLCIYSDKTTKSQRHAMSLLNIKLMITSADNYKTRLIGQFGKNAFNRCIKKNQLPYLPVNCRRSFFKYKSMPL